MAQQFTLSLRRVFEITDGHIGLDDYPLYNGAPEGFREALNQKILDHFYTREIGMESVELWRHNMRRKMNEIMPFYNKVYEAEMLKLDPYSTMSIKSQSSGDSQSITDSSNESESLGKTKSKGRTVGSEFPQTMLNASEDYATSANDSAADGDSSSNAKEKALAKVTNTDGSVNTTSGYTGPASELIMRYRASLINPDLMVIDELNEMFMFVYSNGDAYTY